MLTFNIQQYSSYQQYFQLFEPFGKIVSCVIMKDDNGKSRGFGFVSFETHEASKKVCALIYWLLGAVYIN